MWQRFVEMHYWYYSCNSIAFNKCSRIPKGGEMIASLHSDVQKKLRKFGECLYLTLK